jgi:adenylate cyclase
LQIDSLIAPSYTLEITEGTQRKLAAISAADVVGYSRLMGEDEANWLASFRKWRSEEFGPTFVDHRGEIVKSMGDGWLLEFNSAVDTVTCAIHLQETLASHETLKDVWEKSDAHYKRE